MYCITFFDAFIIAGERPDLIILTKFPTPSGDVNIMQAVAPRYRELGNILLNSPDGTRVATIELYHQYRPESIIYDIFQKWVTEDTTATWGKLVQCLRDIGLHPLAFHIESCLV